MGREAGDGDREGWGEGGREKNEMRREGWRDGEREETGK